MPVRATCVVAKCVVDAAAGRARVGAVRADFGHHGDPRRHVQQPPVRRARGADAVRVIGGGGGGTLGGTPLQNS